MAYPTAVLKVANEWRNKLFSKLKWKPDPTHSFKPGEAGGMLVRADGFSFSAYLKPTKKSDDNNPRAANEKIAADLAGHLDLHVPPVLLYKREGIPGDEEQNACVSLVMYPEVWEWKHIESVNDPRMEQLVRSALARTCGIVAFDTYLGNLDRDNRRNCVYGTNFQAPAEDSFVYIDFAYSMNKDNRWANDGWKTVAFPPIYGPLAQSIDEAVLEATIDKIEQLSDDAVIQTVDRIPDNYMLPDRRSIVREGLLHRRTLIRSELATRYSV